jgi:hypothetical protein
MQQIQVSAVLQAPRVRLLCEASEARDQGTEAAKATTKQVNFFAPISRRYRWAKSKMGYFPGNELISQILQYNCINLLKL